MPQDINKEIEDMATKLEKASTDPREKLFTVIKSLGPDGLKAKLETLSDEDKTVLKAALEEMNLQKAVSFDAEAQGAQYVKGKLTDTLIQEDKADDDADEKLMKPEAANMAHQGTPTEGWSGQVIKSVNESEELTEKVVKALFDRGMTETDVVAKCMQKGMDGKKVQGAVEKFKGKGKDEPKDGKEEMSKAEPCKEEAKDAAKKEVKQHEEKMHDVKKSDDDLEKFAGMPAPKKEKPRGKIEESKAEPEDGNAEAKKQAKKEAAPMKKSVSWDDDARLLKANTLGRNFNFNVEQFINENQNEPTAEPVKKSEGQSDLNDMIEKSEDRNWTQIRDENGHKANSEKRNGTLTKSFDDVSELAQILNLTPEEAKKILGE